MQQPEISIHPLIGRLHSKAAKPYNHTNNPLPFQNPGSPQKTTLKTKPTNLRSPSPKPHQHTSEAHHTPLINTHPKLFSQVTSAYIRSSSLNPHQHTSEALLSSHISTHPKLFSQVPQNSHQNSGYQSISQSVNQSGQPSFSIIIIQNPPKINLNITQKHYNISKPASIPQSPHDKPQKNSPHPHPAQRRCHTISQHTTKKLSPCSHPAQH